MQKEKKQKHVINDDGSLYYGNRICIPSARELRKSIFIEAHNSPYVTHSGNTKIYQDLKIYYWWPSMKRES